jgi:mRNA-degrading endonuclease HigB of HigAB toxin-antitoxin module
MRSFAALRMTDGRRRKYRLVVHVAYVYKRVLVNSSATHAEYDRVDGETVR